MADQVVGLRLQTQGGDQVQGTVGNIKKELRAAQQEAVALSAKFGETSQEALDAAKRVALLRDQIQDTNERIALFDPGAKFAVFGNVLRTVAGGFSALTGSLALFGVQSEEVEKTLLKVQAALAITEGVNTIVDAGKDFQRLQAIISQTTIVQKAFAASTLLTSGAFKALGISVATTSTAFKALRAAIVATGIGALVVGIGLLVEKIIEWTESTDEQIDSQQVLEDATNDLNRALSKQFSEIDRLNKIQVLNARISGKSAEEIAAIEGRKTTERIKLVDGLIAQAKKFGLTTVLLEQERQRLLQEAELEGLEKRAQAADEARRKREQAARSQTRPQPSTQEPAEPLRQLDGLAGDAGLNALAEQRQAEREAELERQRQFEEQRVALITNAQATINGVTAEGIAKQDEYKLALQAREQAELSLFQVSIQAIGGLADLVGRQTAAGKVLALAEIAAGTAVGFINALDIAQKSAKATGPAAAFAFPIFYASQIAAVIGAASRAKAVLQSGSSGGGGGVSAPSVGRATAPSFAAPQASLTRLDAQSINALGDATGRAFVVETDITTGQERRRRLNRAARLG